MLIHRRAASVAPRICVLSSRSLAPLARYSTESAATESSSDAPQTEATTPAPSPASAPKWKFAAKPPPTFLNTKTTPASAPVAVKAAPAPVANKPVYAAKPTWQSGATAAAAASDKTPKTNGQDATVVEAIREIDWTTSFYGAATQPVAQEQYDVLVRPLEIDDIEVKPDGVVYLPEIKYRRRLNEAFGPMAWSLIPRGEAVVGDSIVTREYALIIHGRFVSQSQGENNYFGADQLPSAVEGCKSNALMRCCKDLGIASELWDPTFIQWFKKQHMQEVWVEHATTKKKRTLWYRKGKVEVAYPYKVSPGAVKK